MKRQLVLAALLASLLSACSDSADPMAALKPSFDVSPCRLARSRYTVVATGPRGFIATGTLDLTANLFDYNVTGVANYNGLHFISGQRDPTGLYDVYFSAFGKQSGQPFVAHLVFRGGLSAAGQIVVVYPTLGLTQVWNAVLSRTSLSTPGCSDGGGVRG